MLGGAMPVVGWDLMLLEEGAVPFVVPPTREDVAFSAVVGVSAGGHGHGGGGGRGGGGGAGGVLSAVGGTGGQEVGKGWEDGGDGASAAAASSSSVEEGGINSAAEAATAPAGGEGGGAESVVARSGTGQATTGVAPGADDVGTATREH